jgi:drug/metabolite transporter (DMT)-like permease
LTTTLLWGTSFPGNKLIMAETGPLGALLSRYLVSIWVYLAMAVVLSLRRGGLPRTMAGRLGAVAIFGQALNFLGMTSAIPHLGAGTTSLAIMLVPVLTALLAGLAGLEQLGRRQLEGLVLALTGLFVVVRWGGPERSLASGEALGFVLLFLGALGFANFNVFARPLYAHYTPLEVTAYMGVLAPLALVPLALFEPLRSDLMSIANLSSRGWLLATWLGLASNVAAFFCWYVALRRLGSNRAALFSYLIPVWSVSTAAIWLDEPVTLWLPVGVALVAVGIVLSTRRVSR